MNVLVLLLAFLALQVQVGAQAPIDTLAAQVANVRAQIIAGRSKTQTVAITNAQLARLAAIDAALASLRADATLTAKVDALAVELAAIKVLVTAAPPVVVDPPVVDPPVDPPPPPPVGVGLVQPADLIYQGASRVPLAADIPASFTYGGTALAFNQTNGSLFMVGNDAKGQLVAEITIPAPIIGPVATLNRATLLQPFTDIFEGKKLTVDGNVTNGVRVGGLIPWQGRLCATAYTYYDSAGQQTRSHFCGSLDFSVVGEVVGPVKVTAPTAGMVSGYFTVVPAAWRAALGGPALNGQVGIPIVTRTSSGPALFAIDPADIGVKDPVPSTALVYYPTSHPLSPWDSVSDVYNMATEIIGVVFPEGTRSVLFFGSHGKVPCYGTGTNNQALHLTPTGRGDVYCYDPDWVGNHGNHAYPYYSQVWAYDANDLAAVKSGTKRPWDVRPYAVWPITLPYNKVRIIGAAYDPATGRIFLSQRAGEGDFPVIHVFTLK